MMLDELIENEPQEIQNSINDVIERAGTSDADWSVLLSAGQLIARLRKGISAVDALISESEGVAGLHLNGNIAPWDELRSGGRYEEWLCDFDEALTPNAELTGRGQKDEQ